MTNWLVIANSARARVLEELPVAGAYVHVADLVHPQSRQKGSELEGDRPGRVVGPGFCPGSADCVPYTDPPEREIQRFAMEVAATLDQGLAEGRCGGLVLVASNSFLGRLCAQLSPRAGKAVVRVEPTDYTALGDAELHRRLGAFG